MAVVVSLEMASSPGNVGDRTMANFALVPLTGVRAALGVMAQKSVTEHRARLRNSDADEAGWHSVADLDRTMTYKLYAARLSVGQDLETSGRTSWWLDLDRRPRRAAVLGSCQSVEAATCHCRRRHRTSVRSVQPTLSAGLDDRHQQT